MLTERDRQLYQSFQESLRQFRTSVTRANPDVISLQAVFLDTQQHFQRNLATLDLDALNPTALAQIQSLQTEINKQLRLLGTDVMFLQNARKPLTIQQRQKQMSDRIDLLLRYCDGLLGENGA